MSKRVASVLFLVLTFATGCTSAADGGRGTSPDTQYPAGQAWALNDSMVTDTEYRAAVDGFVSCMRGANYTVGDPILSPIDGVTLLYDLTPTGNPDTWNKKVEECNSGHISHIEPAYVEAREQAMAPALREATDKCLEEKGFTLRGTEHNLEDFATSTDGVGTAVTQCVTTMIPRVFPELPSFLKMRW